MSHPDLPVSDDVLHDLRARIEHVRRVRSYSGGWDRGTDPAYLTELLESWRDYDWRPHEARIAGLPWVDAAGMRAIHRPARHARTAVVLLHGWPDSVLRFERVLPLLDDVDLIVPALPGYPFAEPLTQPGMSATAMADAVAQLLAELGHGRYVVSGGDIGSIVGEQLAHRHPDRVAALHLTDVPFRHLFAADPDGLSRREREYLAAGRRWRTEQGAYAHEQTTRPQTLAVGLGDSPAGLAAWIVEKLRAWSDCGGDVESVFPREDILTWLTAYWVTGTIGTSFAPYCETPEEVPRVHVPTVFSLFPRDLLPAPREFGERIFDVREWTEHPDGGHFAAWERPEAFAAGVRQAVALA